MEEWQRKLDIVVETMKNVSRQTDPQKMVAAYGETAREMLPAGRFLSVTRRGLEPPHYLIARSDLWEEQPNPWTERDKLPKLQGGLLGELVYADEARVIDHLEVDPGDPAHEYFEGMRSLVSIPIFDEGVAKNVVVRMSDEPAAYNKADLPTHVWLTNLFGRATHNLVLSQELKRVNEELDRELATVAAIQKSLLPPVLPKIPNLDLAVHYAASRHAGGDYYDFFPLPEGKWGILVADVAGHGVPAAVLMAISHAIAHLAPRPPHDPAWLVEYLSGQLYSGYTKMTGVFVTAFYGVFDPETRRLTFANAGHPPPRLKHCDDGSLQELVCERPCPPLGILPAREYLSATVTLRPNDQLVFFTDGIVEARSREGELFGTERLDEVLDICSLDAGGLVDEVIDAVRGFAAGRPLEDDITLLAARVS